MSASDLLVRVGRMSPRRPIRETVHREVFEKIVCGELAAGNRVNESTLALELGVSRTPLREVLFDLVRQGFLQSDPGRGFTVKGFKESEIRETYPILWTLEDLGLQCAFEGKGFNLTLLDELNSQLGASQSDPERALLLDADWHDTLIAGCGNERLRAFANDLRLLVRRYEYAYMWDNTLLRRSVQQHALIAAACAVRDLGRAASLLELNWRMGMDALLERFARTDASERAEERLERN